MHLMTAAMRTRGYSQPSARAMTQQGILPILLYFLLHLSAYSWQLQPPQHYLLRSALPSSSSFHHSLRHVMVMAPRRFSRLPPVFSTFPPLSPGDEGKGGGRGGIEDNEDGRDEEELAAFLNLRKNERGGTPIDSSKLVLEVLPYLCLQAEFTIVGTSPYVTALRKKVLAAAKDPERKPVVVLGDVGMRRVDTAVLLHSLTAPNQLPPLRMSAKEITGEPARFFGGRGGRSLTSTGEGLLDLACNSSAVIITKVESLQPHLLARLEQLVNEGTYSSVEEDSRGAAAAGPLKQCRARILVTGQDLPPGLTLKKDIKTIQLLPLKKHRVDVQPEVMQVLGRVCDESGKPVPKVSESAYRFLTAYDFPGNLEELEMLVTEALTKIWRRGGPNEINENDLFDKAFDIQRANLRNNLFETVPWLRQFLRDIDWPKGLNQGFTRYAFPIYVAGLFLGPQDRDHNVLLQFFWSWWWPAIMLIYPVLARIWCSVCPFMIYGEWAQETLLKVFPTFKLKKWPKAVTDKWGPWVMYGLFVTILYWEELWDLPQNASLSAWLLLLITGGAILTSLQYEKRLWCHTLCPIGGMNGMYAKLSVLSVRTEPGLCQSCGQYLCINNEKNNKPGCPLNLIPSQLPDNSQCVNCLQCATDNCPYDNVGLYIRPLAVDISSGSHEARDWEVCLMLLLMGNVFMRRLPQILTTLHLPLSWLDSFPTHAAATTVALFLPAVITYGVHRVFQAPKIGSSVRLTNELKPAPVDFVNLAYGYLPLAWAANTATWGEFFLREAPNVIPVTAMSVGISAETAYSWLPHLTLSNDLVAFLQLVTLFIGAASSIWLTNAITHRSLKEMLPQVATILGLDFLFAVSVLGPGPPWH